MIGRPATESYLVVSGFGTRAQWYRNVRAARRERAFAPRNRTQVVTRNAVVGLMGIPLVARLAMGRSLRDPIELPSPPTA